MKSDKGRKMIKRATIGVTLLLVLLALTTCFAPIPLYSELQHDSVSGPVIAGRRYCQRLNKDANDASGLFLTLAVIASMLSAAAVITGGVIGPDLREGANWLQRSRNTLIVGLGGILAIPTTTFYFGQNRAASAAAISAQAMAIADDELAYKTCLAAKADWISSRNQTSDTLQNQFYKQQYENFLRNRQPDLGMPPKDLK